MDGLSFLIRLNDILTAGLSTTAFALLLYFLIYNRKSRVARTFSGLLASVFIVYLVDLLLTNIQDVERASFLLRFQWLGIAFTPILYLEFARAIRLLVLEDRYPRGLRLFGVLLSVLTVILAWYTDWVVYDGTFTAGAAHLRAGPLFYPFALLLILSLVKGIWETLAARQRCYTRVARRRMTYLSIGFIGPALGVFPYLLFIGWPSDVPEILLWILLLVGNVAVAAMLVLVAYGTAFISVFTPERIVKHRLVRFLLRGPVAASLALVAFAAGTRLERELGLGAYTLSLMAMALAVISAQLGVELFKPLIDLALYREGRDEVAQVQALSQRLLTTADLYQFLESILAATCELLRSSGGFIAILDGGQPHREIWYGRPISADNVAALPVKEVAEIERQDRFIVWRDYHILPIRDKAGERLLGIIGLWLPDTVLSLHPEQEDILDKMLIQASAALEDRQLQTAFFKAFTPLIPELEAIQRRSGMLRYDENAAQDFSIVESPQLPKWVHNALSHYWGGPRLTASPLLDLQVVQQAAEDSDGDAVNGLRSVLSEALERLKPAEGRRDLTAPEWLLYNILEMKFMRGQKVREVAKRLALSESDLYRKQRIAIENLCRILVEMEEQAQNNRA